MGLPGDVMNGTLQAAWTHLSSDLWESLAAYAWRDVAAPPDLFSDLFTAADEYVSPRAGESELAEAQSDPAIARERFIALRGEDFVSELGIVRFLEDVDELIEDYDIAGFSEDYRRLLRLVLRKFNLRYRLDDPFYLRFLVPGSFVNLYNELLRIGADNAYLTELFGDFEKAFDQYVRSGDSTDLKSCLGNASNYLEGLAGVTCGHVGTLGALTQEMNDWPHAAIRSGLADLYKFCSDYPGIRHGGNPEGMMRELSALDLAAVSLLLMSYSGYLSPLIDELAVLGI
jgi:hypothetical protein